MVNQLRKSSQTARQFISTCSSIFGTLDAVHLATALIWRDRMGPLPAMATYDTALGSAARAFGFEVLGT
jgi:hypothetical protein